jgi:solute carrier family 12 sodium/potassium/chloride transporter 2
VISEWLIDEADEKLNDEKDEKVRMRITKSELINLREQNNRHIRLRELLLEYSYEATLIVMSMPRPGKILITFI